MSSIQLSFQIKPPSTSPHQNSTFTHEIPCSSPSSGKDKKREELLSLRSALEEARQTSNEVLTRWKDAIGELEKGKERDADEEIKRARAQNQDELDSDEEEDDEQGE
jgi:hypothetical protein